jgi:hypothetical protein
MKYLFLFCIHVVTLKSFSQKDSTRIFYPHLDTIEAYTNIMIKSGPGGFFVNEKRIDKRAYDIYKRSMEKADNCRPCWIKNFTIEGEFVSEGAYYSECLIGKYFEYHSNGKLKTSGQYKENHTGIWNDLYKNGYCRRDGLWIYYDETGKIVKREKYENGKVVN